MTTLAMSTIALAAAAMDGYACYDCDRNDYACCLILLWLPLAMTTLAVATLATMATATVALTSTASTTIVATTIAKATIVMPRIAVTTIAMTTPFNSNFLLSFIFSIPQ